ncbi:MAG: glutamate racemase [Candidatus Andersenbacteria bacterium]
MIGIFDSGYGGLTIARALMDALPQYSYVYLGDNARAPYGQRSREEILQFTTQGIEYLFAQGCEVVILACNTASANALRAIQQHFLPSKYPHKRVLGIVVPTIEQITGVPWRHVEPIHQALESEQATVGILATEQTVNSGAYEIEITKRNPNIFVAQQACNGLVEAIEANDSEKIEKLIEQAITELYQKIPSYHPPISALLLGCTHFELITDGIKAHLPKDTHVYGQPEIVASSFVQYLKRHPEIQGKLTRIPARQFYTTGNPEEVADNASRYMGIKTRFNIVQL